MTLKALLPIFLVSGHITCSNLELLLSDQNNKIDIWFITTQYKYNFVIKEFSQKEKKWHTGQKWDILQFARFWLTMRWMMFSQFYKWPMYDYDSFHHTCTKVYHAACSRKTTPSNVRKVVAAVVTFACFFFLRRTLPALFFFLSIIFCGAQNEMYASSWRKRSMPKLTALT